MKIIDLTKDEIDFKKGLKQDQIESKIKFYTQTLDGFLDAIRKPHGVRVTVREAVHQRRIIQALTKDNFEVINLVTAGKAGYSDILACSTAGQLWSIETKKETGTLSDLQESKLTALWRRGAVCMVAYGYNDFLRKYKIIQGL